MDTCFIFTEYLTETGCLCLKLAADGTQKVPPAELSFGDIKDLQKESKTILVESCAQATLIELELPWLPERKARAAIPYALEDKLAQPVDELHFAFDKAHYQNHRYLICVIAKQRVLYLMHLMDEHEITFDTITLDWFALHENQVCINKDNLLINHESFKGALSGALALAYIKQHPLNPPIVFNNSALNVNGVTEQSDQLSYTWIAQKLFKL